MDTIYLHGLTVDAVVGIWEWERKIRQKVVIDLDMATDIRSAAASDTLDYKAVAKRVIRLAETAGCELVETLAERIAELCRDEFGVPWVRVRVNKPGAVRGSKDVGVLIERGRRE